MDLSLLIFLTSMAIILYIISRFTMGWIKLSLGWIAGGTLIIIGLSIGALGEQITSTVAFDPGVTETIALNLGISSDSFLLIMALIGLVMIYSSSGEWV